MIEIVIYLLSIAGIICLIRIFLGPSAPDRVIALDALTVLVSTIMVVLSVYYSNPLFLDISIVYVILAFTGTIAIAKYLEGKELGK